VARRNLAAYPQVTITQARFEDWRIAEGAPCDLVFAANAWHWLDPELRYQRASQALRPQGHLAIWNAVHVLPEDGDPFFLDIQDIYQEIGEAPTAGAVMPRPEELPDQRYEIEASGLFDVVDIGRYDWETVYDADGYVELLNTFSGHIAMEPWKRERLYGEVRRRLAERPDGRLRRHWGSVLHVARRRQ